MHAASQNGLSQNGYGIHCEDSAPAINRERPPTGPGAEGRFIWGSYFNMPPASKAPRGQKNLKRLFPKMVLYDKALYRILQSVQGECLTMPRCVLCFKRPNVDGLQIIKQNACEASPTDVSEKCGTLTCPSTGSCPLDPTSCGTGAKFVCPSRDGPRTVVCCKPCLLSACAPGTPRHHPRLRGSGGPQH